MTSPITPATIARLRVLTGWRGNSDDDGEHEEDLDLADWQIRAIYSALRSGAIPIPDDAPQLAAQAAEIERLRAELSESEKRVTAIVVIGAILGSDWFCEQADGAERPSWSDALDIVRKLKGERNAAKARVAELEAEVKRKQKLILGAIETVRQIKPCGHEGDEESGQHDEGCELCAWEASMAQLDEAAALAKREGGR